MYFNKATKTEEDEMVRIGSTPEVVVDRTNIPTYPHQTMKLVNPEMETVGPSRYNLSEVELWPSETQEKKSWRTTGHTVFKELEKEDFVLCLNLQDGIVIKEMGIKIFRKFWKGKRLFFWGTVVRYRNGNLYVPYLCEKSGQVIMRWKWLNHRFNLSDLALRFKK